MHALFNAMFFYDLHVAASVLGCVVPNRERLTAGFAALADLEALLSLACFASESLTVGGVSYPKFVDNKVIEIIGGKHPLIDVARVVPNDIHLTPKTRLWVVTGSNMAGKSTLLRMCGVNCLLAQIGTVVMAEAMTLCPVRLISDLQVRDNLADDESYFLAEVRHLRRMVVPESDGGHILGLMDEPFRGTNSAEQVAAALAVVEHLLKTPNFFLLATHEQQLTGLADKLDGAENRHFQENLSAEGLVYDYRLRPGPAVTRNALRVLQREGYPRELLDRAQEWLGTAERGSAGEA
jgi:DNA mismatch repair ATPase MutS